MRPGRIVWLLPLMIVSALGRVVELERWIERIFGGEVEIRMLPDVVRTEMPSKIRTEWMSVVGILECDLNVSGVFELLDL